LVGFTVLVDGEGHETSRKVVRNGWPPLDDPRIVVPMFEIGEEIRRRQESQNELSVLFRDRDVAVTDLEQRAEIGRVES